MTYPGKMTQISCKANGQKRTELKKLIIIIIIIPFLLTDTKPRLTPYVRRKTTSEHVMKLRGQLGHFKTQQQLAVENKAHMNYMPVPEGSWREYHQLRNMKWSRMLYSSISALGITIYCVSCHAATTAVS